ncbi:hypothetical protein RD110_08075 [Rhodoferax koreense]|uniref:Acyltransferase n=1 Tax=Rhodoferax koreensis TaxID=1842727 RepID=A0A1P8JTR4_9BURK|nr:acyltransferase family protein [Rhodoferax koreense]APW37160.1 hypothetical protein RD110_08075 [Rhodoferax koreense]
MQPRPAGPTEFRADINGLRAWAVAAVVLYHFAVPGFSGGFAGVDVFFVISGYLMTGIIIKGLERQVEDTSFDIWKFYLARAIRIIPALLTLCSALMAVGWFFLPPVEYALLSKHAVSALGFFSNIIYFIEIDYFNIDAHYKWLLHTWSLSVEWQFYLVLPILLALLWKVAPGRKNARIAVVLAIFISLAASISASELNPSFAFYLLPTRAWQMLVGGLVFLAPMDLQRSRRTQLTVEATGFLLLILSIGIFTTQTVWPSWRALIPTLGAALVLVANNARSAWTGTRIAQWLGKCSYSIYLWHWPLVVGLFYADSSKNALAVSCGLVATAVLGWLSYRFVEQPTARSLRLMTPVKGWGTIGAPVVVLAAAGIAIKLGNGIPTHMSERYQKIIGETQLPLSSNGWCFYSVDTNPALSVGANGLTCHLGAKGAAAKVLLFGDSFAGHNEPFWDQIGRKENFDVNAVTTNWCAPALNADFVGPTPGRAFEQCLINRKYFRESVKDYDMVVMGGNWIETLRNKQLAGFEEAVSFASTHSATVVIMPSPPRYDANLGLKFARNLANGVDFNIEKYTMKENHAITEANLAIKNIASKYKNVIYLDQEEVFPKSGTNLLDGTVLPLSFDGAHISIFGARTSAEFFAKTQAYKLVIRSLREPQFPNSSAVASGRP